LEHLRDSLKLLVALDHRGCGGGERVSHTR
jgi:hypothetical protein